MSTRLALGTAQLGMAYGITNRHGRPDERTAAALIEAALEAGIDTFDTAPVYGDAETRLGRLLRGRKARVVTKAPRLAGVPNPEAALRAALSRSLDALGRDAVDTLLLHDEGDLAAPEAERIAAALHAVRTEGLAVRIGASFYTTEEAETALALLAADVIQVPLSVADQRMARTGMLARLAEAGVEVQARSAFLQGLLLLSDEALPEWLGAGRDMFEAFGAAAAGAGLGRLEACLAFVLGRPEVTCAVVGAATADELRAITAAARRTSGAGLEFGLFAIDDPQVVEPHRWPAAAESIRHSQASVQS